MKATKLEIGKAINDHFTWIHSHGSLGKRLIASEFPPDFFSGVKVRHSYDSYGLCEIGPDLSRADFTGANLNHTDFRDCTLDYVDFSNAQLVRANLDRTSLVGADLSRVDATAASFVQSVMINTKLDEAILKAADLTDMTISDCDTASVDFHAAVR